MSREIAQFVVVTGSDFDFDQVRQSHQIVSLSFEPTFSGECLSGSAILRAAKVVIVPRSVRRLGAGCFALSEALECVSFQLGSQLEYIGERCFYKCALLKRVEGWPSRGTQHAVFCISPRCSTVPQSDAKSLLRIAPGVVQSAGNHCFSGCPLLGHIEIPANVEVIGTYCFGPSEHSSGGFGIGGPRADQCCSSLARVTFAPGSILRVIEKGAFMGSGLMEITIPCTLESIGEECFSFCSSLRVVTFESCSSLKTIGEWAFKETSLSEIAIPSSVEVIGDWCFHGCEYLRVVTFESRSSLKTIGERAFGYTSLSEVAIPSSVRAESIGCRVTRI